MRNENKKFTVSDEYFALRSNISIEHSNFTVSNCPSIGFAIRVNSIRLQRMF